MSDFQGMEDLLQDFLVEGTDLLSSVDNKLVELEKNPRDHGLLNDIFRGFHTIKGGAGFLSAVELVTLCHLTESLFDRLRNSELILNREIMDVIMDATGSVRDMLGPLERGMQPGPASPDTLRTLEMAVAGKLDGKSAAASAPQSAPDFSISAVAAGGPDWGSLLQAVTDDAPSAAPAGSVVVTPVQAEASASQTIVDELVIPEFRRGVAISKRSATTRFASTLRGSIRCLIFRAKSA